MKFAFYGKYLRGQQEQRALNKRGYELINGTLGEAFGKLYVEKYFPAEAKAQMVELIDYLKKSFAVHINLTWMSSTTKQKAMEKLNKFTVKVAYPDKWKDYSKLISFLNLKEEIYMQPSEYW
jgi:putative endopeptidase